MLEKIKKITEEQTQRMIFYGLAVLIFALPVPQLFLSIEHKGIAMQATILMLSLFYFFFWLAVEGINRRLSFKNSGLASKCVIGLCIVGVFSLIVSDNIWISVYGASVRGEGLFSILTYYSIFFIVALLREEKYRRRLLFFFIIFGCLVSVLGILQYIGVYEENQRFPHMACVMMRNPNFYGAFATLFTGVAVGGYCIYNEESRVTHPFRWCNRFVWYVMVVLGFSACICASSSLVYAGIIMMLLLYFFLEIISGRKGFLSLIILVVSLVVLVFLFNLVHGGSAVSEITSVGNQIKAEGSIFGDGVGSSRMLIWKQTVALIPKYWLFGCGIERLSMHCFEMYKGDVAMYFDKAHNEYLNLWVTEGIFALIFYLVFLFCLFIPGVKRFAGKKKQTISECDEISKIVLFAFFGYIAQACFNISVVQVAPYFWLICGLLYNRKRRLHEETVDC